MASRLRGVAALAFLAFVTMTAWSARAEDAIQIAFIGLCSGAFGPQGDAFFKELQCSLESVNAHGEALGRKFELVSFDDQIQPAEAVIALQTVTDRNIPIELQCVGSNVEHDAQGRPPADRADVFGGVHRGHEI